MMMSYPYIQMYFCRRKFVDKPEHLETEENFTSAYRRIVFEQRT